MRPCEGRAGTRDRTGQNHCGTGLGTPAPTGRPSGAPRAAPQLVSRSNTLVPTGPCIVEPGERGAGCTWEAGGGSTVGGSLGAGSECRSFQHLITYELHSEMTNGCSARNAGLWFRDPRHVTHRGLRGKQVPPRAHYVIGSPDAGYYRGTRLASAPPDARHVERFEAPKIFRLPPGPPCPLSDSLLTPAIPAEPHSDSPLLLTIHLPFCY